MPSAQAIVHCLLDDRLAEARRKQVDPDDPAPYIKAAVPTLDWRLSKGEHLTLLSPISPGDWATAPARIVLHQSHASGGPMGEEWVTHLQNMQNKGMVWGHYSRDYAEALQDYKERCIKLKVRWEDSEIKEET